MATSIISRRPNEGGARSHNSWCHQRGHRNLFQSAPKGKGRDQAKGVNKFDGVTQYGGNNPKIIAALKQAGFKRDPKSGKYISPKYQQTTSWSK